MGGICAGEANEELQFTVKSRAERPIPVVDSLLWEEPHARAG